MLYTQHFVVNRRTNVRIYLHKVMNYPGAVIFVNNDLVDQVRDYIVKQLYINEYMSGDEFDARVTIDPNYPTLVRNFNKRILVIRDLWAPHTNRDLADVVIFVKNGLASIEKNNYGPHGLTLQVVDLYIHKLLRYNNKIK